MLDLGKMRDEIDVIDSEIVRLFEKRMKICENVAQFKQESLFSIKAVNRIN